MIRAYTRCSHIDSSLGMSLEYQREGILRYAAACPALDGQSWDVLSYPDDAARGFFVDRVESAWKTPFNRRPAGKRFAARVQPGDHVIFWSIDRGFRSVEDFCRHVKRWLNMGVNVHFVQNRFNFSSAYGKLIGHIIAAFAQFESDIKSERLKAAYARKRERQNLPAKQKRRVKSLPNPALAAAMAPRPSDSPKPGRIFQYTRVSDITSAKSGLGLADQAVSTARYTAYLKTLNPLLEDAGLFQDATISAWSVPFGERPVGSQIASQLQPGDHIVVARVDRIWRSVRDMAECLSDWQQSGVTCHLADSMIDTSTTEGRMFVEILVMFAKWESETTSSRTSEAVQRLRAEGRVWNQKIPKWIRIVESEEGAMMVPDAKGVAEIWHIMLMRKHGMSWWAISDHMEQIQAHKEHRKPMPRWGCVVRKRRNHNRHTVNKKVHTEARRWTRETLRWAVDNDWPAIKALFASSPHALFALEVVESRPDSSDAPSADHP